MSFCGHSMSLQAVAVFYCFCKTTQPDSLKAIRKTGGNALMCYRTSPKLVQHANSLRAICRRIASTACVPSQAPFPKFLPSGNLRKLACKGHIPLAPYALQKSVITPPGFLIFYAYKNTPPETAYQKFSI